MNKLKQTLENVLKAEKAFLDAESEELNYIKIKDLADKFDEKLIGRLAENEDLKSKFFTKIKDVHVFKINDFKFFLDENKVDNSYTQYANRIGLSDGNGLLENRSEVVLDFPFKDCILEGGQSTEEGQDTYFVYEEEKTKNKESAEPAGYKEKEADRKEVFFNQILAHDEIDRLFEKKALVNWKRFTKDSGKNGTAVDQITRDDNGTIKENLIIKGNNLLALHSLKSEFAGKVKLIYIDPPYNTGSDSFAYNDNFNHSAWLTFMKNRLEMARELLTDDGSIYIQLDYNEVHYCKVLMDEIFGRKNFQREIIWDISVLSGYKTLASNWIRGHDSILFYSKNNSLLKFNKIKTEHNEKYLARFNKKDGATGRMYFDGRGEKKFLDETIEKGKSVGDVWGDIISFQQAATAKERIKGFGGQKPENLLERIVQSATDEGDIVLDYCLGTGTTMVVAHKMGRQYIGVEQMDYIETTTLKRLKDVIGGEQGGISKSTNWKGGGNFIYCELAQWNERAKKEIDKVQDLSELIKLFDTLYKKYFLNYSVRIKEFKDKIVKEDNFKKLTLPEQKLMFLTMLDLNQMYVQESEMADKRFDIGEEDQKLTKEFYKN